MVLSLCREKVFFFKLTILRRDLRGYRLHIITDIYIGTNTTFLYYDSLVKAHNRFVHCV